MNVNTQDTTVLSIPDLSSMLLLAEARLEMQITLLQDVGAFNNNQKKKTKLDILKLI